MKKFKFSLQTVHGVRELQQEREQLVFSQLQGEAAAVANRIESLVATRAKATEKYSQQLASGTYFNPLEMELSTSYLISLDRLERESRLILEQKKQACDRQSEKIMVAAQAVKATAKIRETQFARHQLELTRREQTDLDEMISLNYARALSANI